MPAFRIYWTNFGYFDQNDFLTMEEAKARVEKVHFEAVVYLGDRAVASWRTFGGWSYR